MRERAALLAAGRVSSFPSLAVGLMVLMVKGVEAAPTAPPLPAEELVARVLEGRKIGSLSGRARLVRVDSATGSTVVTRLLVKARRSGEGATVLYQEVRPSAESRRALLLNVVPRRLPAGFFFDGPDRVVPVSTSLLEQPFFGSDLTVGDLVDDFLSWTSHRIVGEEVLLRRRCVVVESSPARPNSIRGKVRSWISPDLALSLKVEKVDAEGQVRRTLTVRRVTRLDDRWTAASLTAVAAGTTTTTTLEGTGGKRSVDVPASELEVEAVRKALRGPPPAPETASEGAPDR